MANILAMQRTNALTDRQQEVMGLLRSGLTARQVAEALDLSTQRIYAVRKQVQEKTPGAVTPGAVGADEGSRAHRTAV